MRTTDRRLTYLNAILTVNAVLIASLAWTALVGDPSASLALASPQSSLPTNQVTKDETGSGGGVPNAGLQRLQIINEIKGLRSEIQRIDAALSSGKMKINVGNLSEIKLEVDYARLKDALKQQ